MRVCQLVSGQWLDHTPWKLLLQHSLQDAAGGSGGRYVPACGLAEVLTRQGAGAANATVCWQGAGRGADFCRGVYAMRKSMSCAGGQKTDSRH